MQSDILNRLTWKDCNEKFPEWTQKYQDAFDTIKRIVVSRECLTIIDHSKTPELKIFVTTDASESATGAVLSFGKTWETARPVAFESMTLKGAELNYPVHEKELLAILRALRKWKVDLLGSEFLVYTDHKTLLNFNTQKELSRRQARWMEELAIYDCKFVYVKGEDNTVADSLSRYPFPIVTDANEAEKTGHHPGHIVTGCIAQVTVLRRDRTTGATPLCSAAALTEATQKEEARQVVIDETLVNKIRAAYAEDPWCKQLLSAARGMPELRIKDGLWFIGERLIIPAGCDARERIFRLAHDTLGHFGFFKTYESLRNSYFWPNMRKDLESGYIPSCIDCQRNKNSTTKPTGPLHPLPIPDERCDSVAMDFIGPLPTESGFDCILTMTDRLNSDIQLVPCSTKMTAEQLAVLFFDKWYCENGLPLEIISDRDKLFMARFWKHLMILTGVKHRASSAYHPQTDGASERSNKTVNQLIRFHVERNQSGWLRALPRVRFVMMNTVNKSTGYSPFQLKHGRSARILPPLIEKPPKPSREHMSAREVITRIKQDVADAKDNLLVAKIGQAHHANEHRRDDPEYEVGGLVMLSTLNRRREHKQKGEKRVAKFMARFDGPFQITDVHKEASTVTIDVPTQPNAFPTYHTSHIKPFMANDAEKYPSRTLAEPGPIMVDGVEEYTVEKIITHRKIGRGYQYRVQFTGWGPEQERWIAGKELEDNEALDLYWESFV
jgi:KaiC/GvpD/RAD55 family RecA-like ATPase